MSAPTPLASHAKWFASFVLALALYVAVRAWALGTAFDATAVPIYEIASIGNCSWGLSVGEPVLPLTAHYDNAGAQILTALLGTVSYAVFGASYLSLKLVPLAFGVLLLALVGRFMARSFGGRAALLGMVSVAVAPPIVTKYSMLAKGNHFEGLTLLFVPLLLALEVPDVGAPRRRLWVIAAGASMGFAIAMYFGALLAVPVLGAAWLLAYGIKRTLADVPLLGAGGLIGLVPFFVLHVTTGGQAGFFASRLGNPRTQASWGEIFDKGRSIVVDTVPDAACFQSAAGVSPWVAERIFLALSAAAWLVAAAAFVGTFTGTPVRATESSSPGADRQRRRKRAALFIVLAYPLAVVAALAVKPLPIMQKVAPVEVLGVRYLLAYFFFCLLLITASIEELLSRKAGAARLGGWLMLAALLATVPFTVSMGRPRLDGLADGLRYPGVHLREYGLAFRKDVHLREDPRVDTTRMKEALERLSSPELKDQRTELAIGIGALLGMIEGKYGGEGLRPPERLRLDEIRRDFDPADHADLLRGVGCFFQTSAQPRALKAARGGPSVLRRQVEHALLDDESGPLIAEGLGMTLSYPLLRHLPTETQRTRDLLTVVPDARRGDVLRGLARSFATHLRIGAGGTEAAIEDALRSLDEADRAIVSAHVDSARR